MVTEPTAGMSAADNSAAAAEPAKEDEVASAPVKKSRFAKRTANVSLAPSAAAQAAAAEAEAAAKDILSRGSKNSVINRDRGRVVQGQDSEDMFSGVRRGADANGGKGRYVPPHRAGDSGNDPSKDAGKPKAKPGGSWASVVNPGKTALEKNKKPTPAAQQLLQQQSKPQKQKQKQKQPQQQQKQQQQQQQQQQQIGRAHV